MDSNVDSVGHIYRGVFLNGSVDVDREEDSLLICVFTLGTFFTKQAKSASDRILMNVSDAMENIKGLI